LGLDRDPAVLQRTPRDPKLPLLDAQSSQFILITGVFKAMVGGALLCVLPYFGHSSASTRTLLFLYITIGQLVFAYPARRAFGEQQRNVALHLSIVFGSALQLFAVYTAPLRLLLGLEVPQPIGFVWVAAAVVLSCGAAEIYGRLAGNRYHRSSPAFVTSGLT
jgi:Ca2+-transporting ATPase